MNYFPPAGVRTDDWPARNKYGGYRMKNMYGWWMGVTQYVDYFQAHMWHHRDGGDSKMRKFSTELEALNWLDDQVLLLAIPI